LPALLDGSDADGPEEQNLEDLGLELDAAGLISYPENIVVVNPKDSFRVGFESTGAFETTRRVRGSSEQGRVWADICRAPPDCFRCLQRIARAPVVVSPLLGVECFR
jgi:hypothetical protein